MNTGPAGIFKILIVDDVPKNIQVVAGMLQSEGYQMAFAQNGKAALDQTRSNRFDLILLDIMMPEMDGFAFCEKIKKDPACRDIPVIFLTAKTDIESTVNGFEMGAVDYVTKPFNRSELLSRVRTHLELHHARRQLQELNATKDKLFSIIAHDLRNPLGAFINTTELLSRRFESLDDKEKLTFIDMMHHASEHVYGLLENLLHWARSQTGTLVCRPVELDLANAVRSTLDLFKMSAQRKGVSLQINATGRIIVFADQQMIETVIRNLISNAIKFTPENGLITVEVRAVDTGAELTVADTGVGIDEDHMRNVFEHGISVTTDGTTCETGTGLGLVLCREFVKENGGEISAWRAAGQGSVFCVRLPGGETIQNA